MVVVVVGQLAMEQVEHNALEAAEVEVEVEVGMV